MWAADMARAGTSCTPIRASRTRSPSRSASRPQQRASPTSSTRSWCRPRRWSRCARGRKVNSERKFFPGYVLVKMDLTDETWHLVKNTPKVTGFLGGRRPADRRSPSRGRAHHDQVQEGVERPKPSVIFEIGEQVRVTDGPFTSFNGMVEEVDEERARLKVAVSIFGRATPVELEYTQVEKALRSVRTGIRGSGPSTPPRWHRSAEETSRWRRRSSATSSCRCRRARPTRRRRSARRSASAA